jgi:YfiH family protein
MEDLNGAARDVGRVSGLHWQGVAYFCTTRQGGASRGSYASLNLAGHAQDDPSHVIENRRRLGFYLPAGPLWLNQVHGTHVVDADSPRDSLAAVTADAAVTARADCVLAIMTADCLPVVMADSRGQVLGVAHAGWRGLANGVLEHTLQCMRAKNPLATQWRAWIGPGISQPHFEVGADVFSAFVDSDPQAAAFFAEKIPHEKWLADLPGLARHRLQQAGVRNVELSGYCTYGQPGHFYSYRREPVTGRMATLAWLSPRP